VLLPLIAFGEARPRAEFFQSAMYGGEMRKWLYPAAAAAGLFVALPAHAALAPFTSNFDSDTVGSTSPTGFTAGGTAIYSIVQQSPGDNALQASSAVNSGSEAVSLTNIASNILTLSTDATLTTLTAGSTNPAANFGFGLFGDSANFSTGSQYRLLLTTVGGTPGTLSFVRSGTNQTSTISGTPLSVAAGTNYNISVTATPVGSNLVFHATATDGTNTTFADYTDTSPLAGTWFGYRTATAASGTSETVQYDNFSATTTVPEPASIGTLGAAAGLLLMRRRRSS
jgi:hypothetical protein